MNHEEASSRLNDYVDALLAEDVRNEVETHLKACDLCRDEVRFLRSLLEDTAALPRAIAPDRDIWSGIADQIGEDRGASVDLSEARRRPAWPRWPLLAAAAVVLMAVSSAITAFIVRDWTGSPLAEAPRQLEGRALGVAATAQARALEASYDFTIRELTAALGARRDVLSSETIRVVEANLTVIDEAIRTSRAALESDPGNQNLIRTVTSMYEEKIAFLQQATDLPDGS